MLRLIFRYSYFATILAVTAEDPSAMARKALGESIGASGVMNELNDLRPGVHKLGTAANRTGEKGGTSEVAADAECSRSAEEHLNAKSGLVKAGSRRLLERTGTGKTGLDGSAAHLCVLSAEGKTVNKGRTDTNYRSRWTIARISQTIWAALKPHGKARGAHGGRSGHHEFGRELGGGHFSKKNLAEFSSEQNMIFKF